jgi:hypothetical protein
MGLFLATGTDDGGKEKMMFRKRLLSLHSSAIRGPFPKLMGKCIKVANPYQDHDARDHIKITFNVAIKYNQ